MKPIVVVGSINIDLVIQSSRVPAPGETVQGNSLATHHGGKGANQAVAASRMGAQTALIGCVGDDRFGCELLDSLRRSTVNIEAVHTVDSCSGTALIQLDDHGENRITVIAGANARLTPAVVAAERVRIREAGMVLTQLETPTETAEALAALCHTHSVPLMLDPAPVAWLPRKLLNQLTWLTPNLTEACTLLGRAPTVKPSNDEVVALASALLGTGCSGVLLKLGAQGAVVAQRGCPAILAPAFPISVVDTTAAGDATNAAFAAALLRKDPIEAALRQAMAAGALTAGRPGAQPSLPTYDDVQCFLREHTT